jgi:MFS superfamily sulfate permease-like transporter
LALAAAQKYQADRQQVGGGVSNFISDLMGSGSGGHGGSYSGGGGYGTSPGSCFSIDICPDIILAVIAAAAAAAVYLLYTTITAGRKKRSSDSWTWGGWPDLLSLGRNGMPLAD